MKKSSQNGSITTFRISYQMQVSLAVSSISLIFDNKSYLLQADDSAENTFSGEVEVGPLINEDRLYVEIRGTSPHNERYITGKISLKVGEMNLGNYDLAGVVIINNFRCVIGYLLFDNVAPLSCLISKNLPDKQG